MVKGDDNEATRRRERARLRPSPPASIASPFEPLASTNPPPLRSAKMKMASLMAVVEDESKSKRVKVDDAQSDNWAAQNGPISITSLTTNAESPPTSVFQKEMPTVVSSFSREGAATNGERKRAATSDARTAATRSILDVYFPSSRNETTLSSGTRSLKRKRKSGRREELVADVDLLRFGVDAAKLVPQGLVDRVDAHVGRAVLVNVVKNHVTNWCHRAGFASTFFQELTTLLAAYYPCNYATLLDDVLAGFLFQRPEFIELVLPAMLAKMNRAGESILTLKYPVADALARMCRASTTRTERQVLRHDLACSSLVQCLVEHNGDDYALSPWLAACAIASSDRVLQSLWQALLPYTDNDMEWRVTDPRQQMVELLAEEGKLCECRLSCGFVTLLLRDDTLRQKLVDSQSDLISDCLARAFKFADTSWSSLLLAEWLERRRKQQTHGLIVAKDVHDLMNVFACCSSTLSVKKPEWFIEHVLSFLLSSRCDQEEQAMALRVIVCDRMFMFGACAQLSKPTALTDALSGTASLAHDDIDVERDQSILMVQRNVVLLVGLLRAANARTSAIFFDLWTKAWSSEAILLPWGYVRALLFISIQDVVDYQSELGQKLQNLSRLVCRSYFCCLHRRVAKHKSRHEMVSRQSSEALQLLLPCHHPAAGSLLHEVLEALVAGDSHNSSEASVIVGNVIVSHLGHCRDVCVDRRVQRQAGQKSLRRDDGSPIAAATTTANLLTALQTLALIKTRVGELTRRVLSTGPVVRLFARLLNCGRRRRRQEVLLDVINVVVSHTSTVTLSREWGRQSVVQELVYCAYTGPPFSARKAIAVLQNMSQRVNDMQAFLWVILAQCTRLSLEHQGGEYVDSSASASERYHERAGTIAELVKTMVVHLPTTLVCELLNFVEQQLLSRHEGKTRTSVFLLLLLQKLVVCDVLCDVFLPVVQLAVCPLAPLDQDHICLIQLQLLKALCTRLIAIRHCPGMSKAANRRRWEQLVCNARIQSDLRSLVNTSCGVACKVKRSSRAFTVLAQSILTCTHQFRQQSPIVEDKEAQRIRKMSSLNDATFEVE